MTAAYYNENDAYAAQWLRNLIEAGHVAPGVVDERDIRDVRPDELRGFAQCHFFAGIGVWSHALRRAGWSDDRPIWTGSCPCQPFSVAGARGGEADERHLWPHWHYLVDERRPPIVVGEQVASKDGLGWLDLVSADLEASGYAFGASDLCAAGFGGAHIRQRLYFVGLAHGAISGSGTGFCNSESTGQRRVVASDDSTNGRLADDSGAGPQGRSVETLSGSRRREEGDGARCGSVRLADEQPFASAPLLGRTPVDWLFCRDGKWRPVEPGTFPLAHEIANRVGRLRAYGNALDAETATGFVEAVIEASLF